MGCMFVGLFLAILTKKFGFAGILYTDKADIPQMDIADLLHINSI
jgi:hypothetical protein